MPLEMWRDCIRNWRGRPKLKPQTLLQLSLFKRYIIYCALRTEKDGIHTVCAPLQSIDGEFEQMQDNLEEFQATQAQFCQSFSQRIGK